MTPFKRFKTLSESHSKAFQNGFKPESAVGVSNKRLVLFVHQIDIIGDSLRIGTLLSHNPASPGMLRSSTSTSTW
ncbi:hypothetical protein Pelo_5528 [Pelomyxa schiedti]|nr:hypothetical protein Pelo_5528 [Pelomyxa schiedti]